MARRSSKHHGPALALIVLACAVLAGIGLALRPVLTDGKAPGKGGTYKVVALGDAVPAGVGSEPPGYVQVAADQLAMKTGRKAQVTSFARPEMKTDVMVGSIAAPGTPDALAEADLVILQVGADDFTPPDPAAPPCTKTTCWQKEQAALRSNLRNILQNVNGLSPRAKIVVVGYWNVFLDGQAALAQGENYAVSAATLTNQVNSILELEAAQVGALFLDPGPAMRGTENTPAPRLNPDGENPNKAGHAAIGKAVSDLISASGALPKQP